MRCPLQTGCVHCLRVGCPDRCYAYRARGTGQAVVGASGKPRMRRTAMQLYMRGASVHVGVAAKATEGRQQRRGEQSADQGSQEDRVHAHRASTEGQATVFAARQVVAAGPVLVTRSSYIWLMLLSSAVAACCVKIV